MKRDLKKAFGKVIKQLRQKQGLSQQAVADFANIDRAYLSELERGMNYPSLNVIYKLAEAFGLRASELVEEVDEDMGL